MIDETYITPERLKSPTGLLTWFASDMHFGHERIIELADRPFGSVDEMNETLVANWNAKVEPRDDVWILGDIVMGDRMQTLKFVGQLNGVKYLVPGNHDKCWGGTLPHDPTTHKYDTAFEKMHKWIHIYEEEGDLTVVGEEITLVTLYEGQALNLDLCHFPVFGDSHEEDRYKSWRPKVSPTFNIHGHTHAKHKLHDGNQIHIGVDAWDYAPVSKGQIIELLDPKAIEQAIEHSS